MKNQQNDQGTADQVAAKLRSRDPWWRQWLCSCRRPPAPEPTRPGDRGDGTEQAHEGRPASPERVSGPPAHEVGSAPDGGDERFPTPGAEEQPVYCGPEATDWFVRELAIWMTFAWNLNNLALAWGAAAHAARPWRELLIPQRVYTKSYQYAVLAIVARQLTYAPTTTFVSAAGLCPCNCANTVTLCQGCIDRSELGNFLYGVIARYMQMTWIQTFLGGIAGNRGRRTASDAAAIELGFDFIDGGAVNAGTLCAFLAANAALWAAMQQDGNGCPPCNQSVVPVGEPHVTLPAIATLTPATPIPVTLPPRVVGRP